MSSQLNRALKNKILCGNFKKPRNKKRKTTCFKLAYSAINMQKKLNGRKIIRDTVTNKQKLYGKCHTECSVFDIMQMV